MTGIADAQIPLVSVVIPAYNAADHIAQAVESVLCQTYPNVELIVVDDGSTDQTAARARSMGSDVQLIRQRNAGPASARNTGIRAARGQFVGLLDADDKWLPNCLRTQLDILLAEPDALMVAADMAVRFEDGRDDTTWFTWWNLPIPSDRPARPSFGDLFRRNVVATSTVVMRRDVLDEVGFFDESIPYGCEDWDLWLRMASRGTVLVHSAIVAQRLQHSESLSAGPGLADSKVAVLRKVSVKFPKLVRQWGLNVPARIAYAFFARGYRSFDRYDFFNARRDFLRSLAARPTWRSLKYLLATFLGTGTVELLRRAKGATAGRGHLGRMVP